METKICPLCNGSRLHPGRQLSKCITCDGYKTLVSMKRFVKTVYTCPTCIGDGLYIAKVDLCIGCNGLGLLLLEPEVEPLELTEKVKSIRLPKLVAPSLPKIKNPFRRKS